MARPRSFFTRLRESYNALFGYGFGARQLGDTQGGLWTPTGVGSTRDKAQGAFYTPSHYTNLQLEVIYRESWAAGRAVDMPVDDMFIDLPVFEEGDDNAAMMLNEALEDLELYRHLADAMKKARLHGSGLMIITTRGQDFAMPLDIDSMMPNDLVGFFSVERWCASVHTYQDNIMRPRYRQPETYLVSIPAGAMYERVEVHHSRVVRFDGVKPLSDYSPGIWQDRDWGSSDLIRVIKSIMDEEMAVRGITHLTQEASIPIVKSEGFTESLRAGDFSASGQSDEVSMEKVATQINQLLSNYRILFADTEGDVSRVNVPFSGMPDLMDRYAHRIADAVGIPVTRFLSRSPVGLQSTGSGEERNYARIIASRQKKMLKPILNRLYKMVARSIGVAEVPEYHFPSIVDISDMDKATTAKAWMDGVVALVGAGVIDENEGREMLQSAFEEASHLEELTDAELEAIRFDPVEEARIAQMRNNPPSGGGGGGGE